MQYSPQPLNVSIHAPAWGATPTRAPMCVTATGFNPRTRVGCDASATRHRMPFCAFQSTHPRGVRPETAVPSARAVPGFNPRTRVGCDFNGLPFMALFDSVSIHAPAWGATCCCMRQITGPFTFQSTHPRGVRRFFLPSGTTFFGCFNPRTRVGCDLVALETVHVQARFNPRTRVGCDLQDAQELHRAKLVSIHAPAWGATPTACTWPAAVWWFQSTHPRGVRRDDLRSVLDS